MRKILKAVLLCCMIVSVLCACQNTPAKNEKASLDIWNNNWKKEVNIIHDDITKMLKTVNAYNGNIVYSVVKDKQEIFYYTSIDREFLSTTVFSIDLVTEDVLDYCVDANGSIYFLILESVNGAEDIYLKKCTSEGNITTIKCLSYFHKGDMDDCYEWKVMRKPDGSLLVHSYYAYVLLSENGEVIREDSWENQEIFELAYIDNNTALLRWSIDYKMTFYYVNLDTGDKEECNDIPEWRRAVVIKNHDKEACICTASGLYCYNVKTRETECLIQWSGFGIVGDTICGIYERDGEIHCILYDDVLYDVTCRPDETIASKTEIRLGCLGETTQLRRAVAAFNENNDECVVVIEEYFREDEESSVNRLYNAVLAGKGPDIISFSPEYANDRALGERGMLEDLTPYLQESNVIKSEDMVGSVYQSLLVDDRLYMLPTNFVLDVLVTKEKWSGEDGRLDGEAILNAFQEPDAQVQLSREDFLKYGALYGGYSAEPDDVRMKMYIEIADHLSDIVYYQPDDSFRRSGKILFEMKTFSEMKDYLYAKSVWGEDVAFAGFPEAEGNGMAFRPVNCFGINSTSCHKEEAWRFLENYFTEEWQESITPNWYFSISQPILEKQFNAAMKKDYYYDRNDVLREVPILSYDLNGEMIDVYAAEEEDAADLKEMIDRVKVMKREDTSLVNIVQEEAEYYFDDKKDIDEIIDIIHERTRILNEE